MRRSNLTEEEINRFLQACEDFSRLGCKFTENIRVAVHDLKKTCDPVLSSSYVDKAVVDLLTRTLNEFEKKVEVNVAAINKICSKGGKWFAFYLGKSVGSSGVGGMESQKQSAAGIDDRKPPSPSVERQTPMLHARKKGA